MVVWCYLNIGVKYLCWSGYLSCCLFRWAHLRDATMMYINFHRRELISTEIQHIFRPKKLFYFDNNRPWKCRYRQDKTSQAAEMPSPSSFSLDFNQTMELLLLLYQSIITMSVQLNYLYAITWKSPPFFCISFNMFPNQYGNWFSFFFISALLLYFLNVWTSDKKWH